MLERAADLSRTAPLVDSRGMDRGEIREGMLAIAVESWLYSYRRDNMIV